MSIYRRQRAALERIAAESSDEAARAIAREALPRPGRPKKEAYPTPCRICGKPCEAKRSLCSSECRAQHARTTIHAEHPEMMERYIVALKMRLDGLTYKAIGEAFGLSGTMGHYLVWRGGRALNFPENSSHPEKELLNHPDIQKIRGVEQWTSKSP